MRIVAMWAALAVLAGPAAGVARAQSADVTEERRMTLPTGRILVQVFAELNLSEDQVAKPFSIAPDIWYGVSDDLTVGLVHSFRGGTGLLGNAGDGLCLTGSDNGCDKVYNSVGVDGRYHFLRQGGITMSADAGLFAESIDPFALTVKAGAVGRWESGKLAVEAAPGLFIGVTERDAGTKETLILPNTAIFALTPQLGLAGQIGLFLPMEDLGDLYLISLSIGAQYMISEKIFVDATFSLPALVGGEFVNDGADARTFTLGAGYAI